MQNIADGTQDRLQKPVALADFYRILIGFDSTFQFTSCLLDALQLLCSTECIVECSEVFLIFGKSILLGAFHRALDIRIVHFDQIGDRERLFHSIKPGMA